jgi:hypothetical protein
MLSSLFYDCMSLYKIFVRFQESLAGARALDEDAMPLPIPDTVRQQYGGSCDDVVLVVTVVE